MSASSAISDLVSGNDAGGGGYRRLAPRLPSRGLLGEVSATAQCAVRYPLGLVDPGPARVGQGTPVLLVHGYAHNQSGWWAVDRRLRKAGFSSVHRLNYLPLGSGVPMLAERLGRRVEEIRSLTGADRIHVVAHSLGGVLLRWYVQELGGHEHVDTAVTLGTPHQGTLTAALWPERTAQDMAPNSPVMRRLRAGSYPSGVRWVCVYSDADLLIRPTASGRFPQIGVENIEVHGLGHLSLLVAPKVTRTVASRLTLS